MLVLLSQLTLFSVIGGVIDDSEVVSDSGVANDERTWAPGDFWGGRCFNATTQVYQNGTEFILENHEVRMNCSLELNDDGWHVCNQGRVRAKWKHNVYYQFSRRINFMDVKVWSPSSSFYFRAGSSFVHAFHAVCDNRTEDVKQWVPKIRKKHLQFYDRSGASMLIRAVRNKQMSLVDFLLGQGAIHWVDTRGEFSLASYAAEIGEWALVQRAKVFSREQLALSWYVVGHLEREDASGMIYYDETSAKAAFEQLNGQSEYIASLMKFSRGQFERVGWHVPEYFRLTEAGPVSWKVAEEAIMSWCGAHGYWPDSVESGLNLWIANEQYRNLVTSNTHMAFYILVLVFVILPSSVWCYLKVSRRRNRFQLVCKIREKFKEEPVVMTKVESSSKSTGIGTSHESKEFPNTPVSPGELAAFVDFDREFDDISKLLRLVDASHWRFLPCYGMNLDNSDFENLIAVMYEYLVTYMDKGKEKWNLSSEESALHGLTETMKTLYGGTRAILFFEVGPTTISDACDRLRNCKTFDYTQIASAQALEKEDDVPMRVANIYRRALRFKHKFDRYVHDLARDAAIPAGDVRLAKLKGLRRVMEKFLLRPNSGIPWDIVRAQVICPDASKIVKLLELICDKRRFIVLQVNDRFTNQTRDGWSDVGIYMVSEEEGIVGELQIVYQNMMLVRENMHAHDIYDQNRFRDEFLHCVGGKNAPHKPEGAETPTKSIDDLFKLNRQKLQLMKAARKTKIGKRMNHGYDQHIGLAPSTVPPSGVSARPSGDIELRKW